MSIYNIPVSWSVYTEFEVEANSLKEAISLANKMEMPMGEYIDGSYEINNEFIESVNELSDEDTKWLNDTDEFLENL